MTGEYQHNLDVKGRLFIPIRLREELGDAFYLTVSYDRCLSAYSGGGWRVMTDKVSALPYVMQRRLRPLFAYAVRCELDAQGRILIPHHLREFASLRKSVTVLGCNNHAEIWDSGIWSAQNAKEMTPENIASAMEDLAF